MKHIKFPGTTKVHQPYTIPQARAIGSFAGATLAFNARKVALASCVITTVLGILHTVAYMLHFRYPNIDTAESLVRRLGLDRDGNVPTLFSALLLFIAALLLYFVHLQNKVHQPSQKKYWLVLSLVFLFLGLDEATQIHEFTSYLTKAATDVPLPGFLRHAWVIPYLLLLGAVSVYFIPFVLQLPPRTRNLFLVSGFLYVGSAMGMEMLEGIAETREEKNTMLVLQMQTVEELTEMLAIILFNYALMKYMGPQQVAVLLEQDGSHPAKGGMMEAG